MAATLECIGIPSGSPAQIGEWLTQAAAATRELHRTGDLSHSLWRDYSGAAVGIHLRKGRIDCITPWFTSPDGPTRWLVESTGAVIDPECLDCSGADVDVLGEDGQPIARAAVQWLFFRPYRDWLATKRRYRIEVAAFAERCEIFETQEELDRGRKEWGLGDLPIASNAFLPVGMFGDVKKGGLRARARAVIAGPIALAARRENSVTGEKFFQLRIDTHPGRIDVVHPASEELRPKAGRIALVSAWLVARPVDPPPPPRSLWRRIFRR